MLAGCRDVLAGQTETSSEQGRDSSPEADVYPVNLSPLSVQQCPHQHEGAARQRQRSGGALGSSRGHLPPTHPTLPGVIQLDVPRRQLRGDAPDRPQTQTGETGTGVSMQRDGGCKR